MSKFEDRTKYCSKTMQPTYNDKISLLLLAALETNKILLDIYETAVVKSNYS